MRSLSIIISLIIGISSILLFRNRNSVNNWNDVSSYPAYFETARTRIHSLLPPRLSSLIESLLPTPQTNTTDTITTATIPSLPALVIPDTMSFSRVIRKVFLAVEQAEGAGARVRRSIGTPNLRNFSPFLMLDQFSIKPGAGFPDHPHRGQETITYLLSGAVDHEDFAGNKGTIESGDLQFMTAGKGIMHAEMPRQNPDGSANVGLQLWVDLPRELKDCEPRYRDLRATEIPAVKTDNDRVLIKVISGKSHGIDSVQDLAYTPVWILDITVQPGGTVTQTLPAKWNAFAYTLEGKANFSSSDDTPQAVDQYHNVVFGPEGDGVTVTVDENATVPARFVLVAGTPLDQPIVQYGPFVVNSKEEVYKALMDYQTHSNGFERAEGWQSEIGKTMVN